MKGIYASCTYNREKTLEFIKNTLQTGYHCVSAIKDGKLLSKFALAPYDTSDAPQVFSLSKSFCSTAAGFAYDEGLWKPDDRISDYFPDHLPENISERARSMTVGNVLTMGTGHGCCAMNACINSDDPIKAFFAQATPHEPGTKFVYNTGATLMIAALVERLTGESVYCYLNRKLFGHLGIRPKKWQRVAQMSANGVSDGICEGGVGLHTSLDCIERFGELYLNGGVLDGKRILSREWVALATNKRIDNSVNETVTAWIDGTKSDWEAGYGYQFWINAVGGYRADGAFGQFCIIIPEERIIVSALAKADNTERELRELVAFARSLDAESVEGEGRFTDEYADSIYAVPAFKAEGRFSGFGRLYGLEKNISDFTSVEVDEEDGGVRVSFTDGEGTESFFAPFEGSEYCRIVAKGFRPTLASLCQVRREEVLFNAAVESMTESELVISMRFRNCPASGRMIFTLDGDSVDIYANYDCDKWTLRSEYSVYRGKSAE